MWVWDHLEEKTEIKSVCVFSAQAPDVSFSLRVICKTTLSHLKPNWKKGAGVYENSFVEGWGGSPKPIDSLAGDICMGAIGQVKESDSYPLCKTVCAQGGSFEWF